MMTQEQQQKIRLKGHDFQVDYFIRQGSRETILFVHGLGGAKDNFRDACLSRALADHTLISFDHPGTGNSSYYPDVPLDIDDLVALTALFAEALQLQDFFLAGASMGGLVTLLYLLRYPAAPVKGYINIEGNLAPEDCMFSAQVVRHEQGHFCRVVFPQVIRDMKSKGNPGYHRIAINLELNTLPQAYYHYSFQTVAYSHTGQLLEHYLSLPLPRLFLYGDANTHLSYLPVLREQQMELACIPESDHFLFYDNPRSLYEAIAHFVQTRA